MKRILFDFLPFEDEIINGGTLYNKIILNELLKQSDVKIYGWCNNTDNINFEKFEFSTNNDIEFVEGNDINEFIEKNKIDLLFIGIAQRRNYLNLENVRCKIVIVCHDISDICIENNNLYQTDRTNEIISAISNKKFLFLRKTKKYIKQIFKDFKKLFNEENIEKQLFFKFYNNFLKIYKKENVFVVTVSEYSKSAMEYYFGKPYNEINVFYPPEQITNSNFEIKNLRGLEYKKFFLLLSVNRANKNFYIFYKTFKKWLELKGKDYYCVAVGANCIDLKNTISFKSVTNDELVFLLKNCYALVYPSLGEGFGMPPLEAMKFNKPVVAAYDTSIPEVCGDGAIMFNPLYEEGLYAALYELINNYDFYVKKAEHCYKKVKEKQDAELIKMIEFIKNV